jgi:hypothetical protein
MLIGYVTKEMFNDSKIRTLQSVVNGKTYTVPLTHISPFDIGRMVFLTDEGEVSLETMRDKIIRSKFLYDVEKIENKAIVNIDTSGEYVEPTTKLTTADAIEVNKNVLD